MASAGASSVMVQEIFADFIPYLGCDDGVITADDELSLTEGSLGPEESSTYTIRADAINPQQGRRREGCGGLHGVKPLAARRFRGSRALAAYIDARAC